MNLVKESINQQPKVLYADIH